MNANELEHMPGADFRCLAITVSVHGTTGTISLRGEWDLSESPAMEQTIQNVLASAPETLVLDLSRLSFIDSAGVHGIIGLHRRSTEQGTRLVILPGIRAVQRPFDVLGLTETLPFARESVTPAVA